jgi:hypothetical protein
MLLLRKTMVEFPGRGIEACDLEMVDFRPHSGSVTFQVALDGKLAVPATVSEAEFWNWPSEMERHKFLARSARTLLDIFGDARDNRVLSDSEVSARASA